MPIEYMRTKIMSVYPSPKWAYRVQHMQTNQVVAIYNKFKNEGRFNQIAAYKGGIDGVQLSFFDTNKSAMEVL